MVMTKKTYKVIATELGILEVCENTEAVIRMLCNLFKSDNARFDEDRFREWIRRIRNGESTVGLG